MTRTQGLACLAVVGALLSPMPARAQSLRTTINSPDTEHKVGEIHFELDHLRDALADPSKTDLAIYDMAHDLGHRRIPSTTISVRGAIRGWDREPAAPPRPADVDALMSVAQRRLLDARDAPHADLTGAYEMARTLHSGGLVDFDKERALAAAQMGVYRFIPHKSELGTVRLNNFLSLIAVKVGYAFAFATLIHESAHALDHIRGALSDEGVVAGEVFAFRVQYLWLRTMDPYGERLAYLRTNLMKEMQDDPNALTEMALNYANHLDDVVGTGGDKEKIKALVQKLGYDDGHDHGRGQASPTSA